MKVLNKKKIRPKTLKALIVTIVFLISLIIRTNIVQATTLDPSKSQNIEMRAVEIKKTNNGDKQLTFELWANDIDFKGFDVRFAYDGSKYALSNLTTNVETDDENEYFAFENEFSEKLDIITIPYTSGDTTGIRMIISFNPPVEDSENIKNETLISSGKSVLLGKMSFKMKTDTLDITNFKLVEDQTTSPTTGIKINTNIQDCYEDPSTFIFTDKTASNNATLNNLILSTQTDNSTYKEYDLVPTFDKQNKEYSLELNEYIDEMNIEAEVSDEKSTMKIKVPKKAEDGKTIIYEEKDLLNKTKMPVTLNKLGEPDTLLEVTVTAEDGKTQETYKISIHRPYGIIRGSIKYDTIEENENPDIDKTTDLNIYKTGKFNWDELKDIFGEIYENPKTYNDLDQIEKDQYEQSNPDGSYEIYVIPGIYDLQIDKKGFLDCIIKNIEVTENGVIDLENKVLIAGDINRDRSYWTRRYSRAG